MSYLEQYNEISSALISTHITLYQSSGCSVHCVSLSWWYSRLTYLFNDVWLLAPQVCVLPSVKLVTLASITHVCVYIERKSECSLHSFSLLYLGSRTAWSRKTPSRLISSTLWTPRTWCWHHCIVTGDEPSVVLHSTLKRSLNPGLSCFFYPGLRLLLIFAPECYNKLPSNKTTNHIINSDYLI